jgi:hypothetical protein
MPSAPEAAVVELLGRDGRATLVQRVTRWPVRIGRWTTPTSLPSMPNCICGPKAACC